MTDTPAQTPTPTDSPTSTDTTSTPIETLCTNSWKPNLRWRYVTRDIRAYEPMVANGTVYFASQGGHQYAVDAATGELIWRHTRDDHVDMPPALVDDTVYAAGLKAVLAHDATTGALQWRFEPPGEGGIISANVVSDSRIVFVGAAQIPGLEEEFDVTYTRLYAINSRTGDPEWHLSLPTGPDTEVRGAAASDGRVFLLTADGRLRRVDGATGDVEWSRTLGGGHLESGPLLRNGRLYSTLSNRLVVVSAADGDVLWRHQGCNGAPAVTETRVVCATDEVLTAIDRDRHRVQWQARLPSGVVASDSGARAGEGVIYVPMDREDHNGIVVAYDGASGCRFGGYEVQSRRPTPVVSTSERIYFGGLHGDAAMYAVSPP